MFGTHPERPGEGLVILATVYTVKPLYYRHQGDRNKCLHYRGVRFREAGFIIMDFGLSGTK